jgi:hypothetical protein
VRRFAAFILGVVAVLAGPLAGCSAVLSHRGLARDEATSTETVLESRTDRVPAAEALRVESAGWRQRILTGALSTSMTCAQRRIDRVRSEVEWRTATLDERGQPELDRWFIFETLTGVGVGFAGACLSFGHGECHAAAPQVGVPLLGIGASFLGAALIDAILDLVAPSELRAEVYTRTTTVAFESCGTRPVASESATIRWGDERAPFVSDESGRFSAELPPEALERGTLRIELASGASVALDPTSVLRAREPEPACQSKWASSSPRAQWFRRRSSTQAVRSASSPPS